MFREKCKNQRGFTLIELVMVIVILGVMAAVALPKYYQIKKDAEISAAKGIFGGIQGAVANYYAQNKVFPDNAPAALAATHIQPGDLTVAAPDNTTIRITGNECGNMDATYDRNTGILSYDASSWCGGVGG
ncbi:MAG: type II secretion system protein [Deltaproteobacteria bacterium]|nr:type II secretion system protein [Deltaproteobacteria bacterium]